MNDWWRWVERPTEGQWYRYRSVECREIPIDTTAVTRLPKHGTLGAFDCKKTVVEDGSIVSPGRRKPCSSGDRRGARGGGAER